jgi:hypothetical protein
MAAAELFAMNSRRESDSEKEVLDESGFFIVPP